ncbi:MAG: amino acid permease [Bacillota bacterium]
MPLKKGLNSRQLAMISIGGVIGVGMFLGSASALSLAGPGVIAAYAVGGVIMLLVMMALAEMSVAEPSPGSFRLYAAKYLHPYAGFLTGWVYWLAWVAIMSAEIVAVTTYMDFWIPHRYSWIFGIVFAMLMTLVNLRSVASFGEFEFWFSMIKVVAIVAFIGIGAAFILGVFPRVHIGTANYLGQGGFFPKGLTGILLAMVMVMFAYGGTEVIGVAAGESTNPRRDVPRALNGIVLRTLVLYIGSIAVLVGVIPWNQVGLRGSPFVLVYEMLGIAGAANVMNFVVITAALSSMNSGLYTSSRILYNLAEKGDAPRLLSVLNRHKVPANAVVLSTLTLYAAVLVYYLSPRTAFLYITAMSSFGVMFTWLMISLTHLYFRPKATAAGTPLSYRMPGYPYTTWVAIVSMAAIILAIYFVPGQRIGFVSGISVVVAVSACYWLMVVPARRRVPAGEPARGVSRPASGLDLAGYFGLWPKEAKGSADKVKGSATADRSPARGEDIDDGQGQPRRSD